MKAEDFQSLYKLIRGSKLAMQVIDAQNLTSEGKYAEALSTLQVARDAFANRRSKTLKRATHDKAMPDDIRSKKENDDKVDRRRQRKEEKSVEAIATFDQLLTSLERLALRDAEKSRSESSTPDDTIKIKSLGEPAITPSHQPTLTTEKSAKSSLARNTASKPVPIHEVTPPQKEALQRQIKELGRIQIIWLKNEFVLEPVLSETQIDTRSLYFVKTAKASLLVSIKNELNPRPKSLDPIKFVDRLHARPIKEMSVEAVMRLGERDCLFRLLLAPDSITPLDCDPQVETTNLLVKSDATRPDPKSNHQNPNGEPQQNSMPTQAASGDTQATDESSNHQNVLDLGAFSQLLTSAQRSGLVPNSDQVGYVRDKEFRQGKYDMAFQSIDIMYNRFIANAGQRLARLSREDVDIAAGRIRISPKDLQAKRSRDRIETQEIDRAKRRFQVVLEGLRILMNRE